MLIDEYGYEHLTFAGPLKREIALLGFDQRYIDEKPEWMRKLLIALGMARRAIDPQYWIGALNVELTSKVHCGSDKFVCDDCRFENEINYFKGLNDKFDVTYIRIERWYDEPPRTAVLDDESETALDRYDGFDHVITAASGDVPGLLAKVKNALFEPKQLELPLPMPEGGAAAHVGDEPDGTENCPGYSADPTEGAVLDGTGAPTMDEGNDERQE